MSLDNAPVVEAPAAGQETATTPPASSDNETNSRYEGFSSPDAPEPAEANQGEGVLNEKQPEDAAQATEGDESTDQTGEDEATTEADPWEGYEDFEIDGTVKKVPSEWKDYLMRQADYTRKTQEVSARAKELDGREQQINQRQQLSEAELNSYVQLTRISEQLKEFEGLDWNAEASKIHDDPIALGELNAKYMRFQHLQGKQAEAIGTIQNAAQQRTEIAQQNTAKRLAATRAYAEKNLKGWTPELDTEITNWATENGFDRDTLTAAYTPQVYATLFKAFKWDQSLKGQQSAKPINPAIPQGQVKPTQSVTARANVARTFDAETASMDDYAKEWAARQKRR